MLTDPIKNKEDIETLKGYFLQHGRVRDYVLFSMGINSGISVNNLIALKWSDIYNPDTSEFASSINVKSKRSEKAKKIVLNENCKSALSLLLKEKNENIVPEEYVFASKNGGPITRFRAFQIIKRASARCGIEGNISCESMKKTFSYYSYSVTPNL